MAEVEAISKAFEEAQDQNARLLETVSIKEERASRLVSERLRQARCDRLVRGLPHNPMAVLVYGRLCWWGRVAEFLPPAGRKKSPVNRSSIWQDNDNVLLNAECAALQDKVQRTSRLQEELVGLVGDDCVDHHLFGQIRSVTSVPRAIAVGFDGGEAQVVARGARQKGGRAPSD